MSETTTKVLWFIFGATCGSFVSWFIFKKKHEEEDSFELTPEMFGGDEDGDSYQVRSFEDIPKETLNPNEDELVKNSEVKRYFSDSEEQKESDAYEEALNYFKDKESEEYERVEKPYVISPDEFGELYDYSKVSLFYWADGVLTDDDYYRIDDEFDLKSLGVLEMFESGDVDAVYIRNDRKQQDIEVLYELRTYIELLEEKPYLKE